MKNNDEMLKLAGVPKVTFYEMITRKVKKLKRYYDDVLFFIAVVYLIILAKLGLARK